MRVASRGPLDARLIIVGGAPSVEEAKQGQPFLGPQGRLLNKILLRSGFDRSQIRFCHAVPERGPHSQGQLDDGLLQLQAEASAWAPDALIMPLGPLALQQVTGLMEVSHEFTHIQAMHAWRGSLMDPAWQFEDIHNEYWRIRPWTLGEVPDFGRAILPSYHPVDLLGDPEAIHWSLVDFQKASRWLKGVKPPVDRQWFFNEYDRLYSLVQTAKAEALVAIDTELSPWIMAIVTAEEVHAFEWDSRCFAPVKEILQSPRILKVAHNVMHDWRFCEKFLNIRVKWPWFDTMGGAQTLEPAAAKSLSPHMSSKFTLWPFHKYMAAESPLWYCGLDTVVAYDAYWSQIDQLMANGVSPNSPAGTAICGFTQKLSRPLYDMLSRGVKVDMKQWPIVKRQLEEEEAIARMNFTLPAAARISPSALGRFKHPHLFHETKVCTCCRAASKKRLACWSCANFDHAPSKKELLELAERREMAMVLAAGYNKAQLEEVLLPPCQACKHTPDGKITTSTPINPGSKQQVADILYRSGLGIRPRYYQKSETVRAQSLRFVLENNLSPVARQLLTAYLQWVKVNADLKTIERLEADADGRLHCVFDPWKTVSMRVACSEGLMDKGTNLMNIPKAARRLIVPDPGRVFGYPDFAQIEARCVAVLSGDEAYLNMFKSGEDTHELVRDLVNDCLRTQGSEIRITRDQAKMVAHASNYGVAEDQLCSALGISFSDAQAILGAYFHVLPGVKRWQKRVRRELETTKAVVSPNGWRRRWLTNIVDKKTRGVRDKIWKEGLSTAPQVMGAHVMGLGMNALYDEHWSLARGSAHVHDALLLQLLTTRLKEAILTVEETLSITLWDMPFPCEMSVGPDWYVASLSDSEKIEKGYGKWTRECILKET